MIGPIGEVFNSEDQMGCNRRAIFGERPTEGKGHPYPVPKSEGIKEKMSQNCRRLEQKDVIAKNIFSRSLQILLGKRPT